MPVAARGTRRVSQRPGGRVYAGFHGHGRSPDVKMPADDPRAVALSEAIRAGDVEALERLLAEHEELATARLVDPACGDERTPLHVLTDWPGRFPNGRALVATLVAAGADPDAAFGGAHGERP